MKPESKGTSGAHRAGEESVCVDTVLFSGSQLLELSRLSQRWRVEGEEEDVL